MQIRLVLITTVSLLATAASQAGLVFTIENPGVEGTTVAGATTETFDGIPLGVIGSHASAAVDGTYSGGEIIPFDVYGGAGAAGRYDVVGLGRTTSQTLTFNAAKTYFGLWWSAGDASNTLTFFNGASQLAEFHIGDIIPFLSPAYYGNPDTGGNPGEPYAYLNFTTTGSDLITKVVIGNLTGSGFESDNHSVFDKPITPPGHSLPDSGSTAALLALSISCLLMHVRRR